MKAILKNNRNITENLHILTFAVKSDFAVKPGQFVNITAPDKSVLLRRPFSIIASEGREFSVLIKVIGSGTESITRMKEGDETDVLYPLGNGYADEIDHDSTLFIAGGIGIAGIMMFLKEDSHIVFGDRRQEYSDMIEHMNLNCIYFSEEGNTRYRGFVSQYSGINDYRHIVACGPMPMFKSILAIIDSNIRFTVICEEIMACGIGLCNGCALRMKDGSFRKVCTDGPVFNGREIEYD
ncbi:MAG: FAD-binding oxidoreductase [bacterium]